MRIGETNESMVDKIGEIITEMEITIEEETTREVMDTIVDYIFVD